MSAVVLRRDGVEVAGKDDERAARGLGGEQKGGVLPVDERQRHVRRDHVGERGLLEADGGHVDELERPLGEHARILTMAGIIVA
jgi:hypothetical protein